MENCIICGAKLVDGKCPNEEMHLKKMCLNCTFMKDGMCVNEENMSAAKAKLLASIQVPAGYELGDLTIKPVLLKDATRKCGKHSFNKQLVIAQLFPEEKIGK